MPSFTYSRQDRYWRALCRNRLFSDTGNDIGDCSVCIFPDQIPPRTYCDCTPVTRPSGIPAAMTLRLGAALGADSYTNTATGSNSVSSPAGATVMTPAGGIKTQTNDFSVERLFSDVPTETELFVRNTKSYVPELPHLDNVNGISDCVWIGISNLKFHWAVHHGDCLDYSTAQSYTYTDFSGGTSTGQFYPYAVTVGAERVTGTINLSNNDASACWAAFYPSLMPMFSNFLTWKNFCPSIAQSVDPKVGYSGQIPVSGSTSVSKNRLWISEYGFSGYVWIVELSPSTQTLTGTSPSVKITLGGHSGLVLREYSSDHLLANTMLPSPVSGYPRNDRHYTLKPLPSGQSQGYLTGNYPASYHTSLPGYTHYGYSDASFYPSPLSSLPSGLLSVTRDPFGGGIGFNTSGGIVINNGYKILATWEGYRACSDDGEIEATLVSNYRTGAYATTNPIYAGPTTFPTSLYLDIGDSGP